MTRNTGPESESPERGPDAPVLPPKIINLFAGEFEPTRSELPPRSRIPTQHDVRLKSEPEPASPEPEDREADEPATSRARPDIQALLAGAKRWAIPAATVLACALLVFIVVQIGRGCVERRGATRGAAAQRPAAATAGGKAAAAAAFAPRFDAPPAPPSVEAALADLSAFAAAKASLARLDETLAGEIETGAGGLRPYIAKASLSLIDPLYGLGDEDLKRLTPAERAPVALYRDVFSRLGRTLGTRDDRAADAAYLQSAGETLSNDLAASKDLGLPKLVLCRSVIGFSRYEAFTDAALKARHLPLIQAYVEIANPKAEVRDDGRHVYRLSEQIRLFRNSTPAAPIMDTTVSLTEVTMGSKHDFFAAQYLRPSRAAEPGDYTIEVRVTDQVSGQVASAKAPLRIVAD